LFIPNPDPDFFSHPGFRIRELKKHQIRIRNTGRIRSHYTILVHCELNISTGEKNTLSYPFLFYSVGFPSAGLFSVSRHPNYLAEISLWFVFYAFSITAGGG
jgi:hypothetical protein